jgi:DNA/RNA endonuclease YhcR with UshA esterase domain
MKEKTLFKIALLVSFTGILALYFISEKIEIPEKTIDEINVNDIEKDVKLKGTVTRADNKEKIIILEISQPNTISVVLFKEDDLTIEKGTEVQVIGQVDEFNGRPEIIANEIKII